VELTWTTFILETINFLVLVWILHRFLYRPVLNIIAKRREAVEKSLADAEQTKREAETVREQYEHRNADWQQEREAARSKLNEELEAERRKRLDELQTTLEQEREKARAADTRRLQDEQRKVEQTALQQASAFASRLLSLAAGPDLETRLIDIAIQDLSALDEERRKALHESWTREPEEIVATSVHPIPDEQRKRLEQALAKGAGISAPVTYKQDASLLAGVRLGIGAWVLGTNLADELKGYTEIGAND
jgi:F-type H+-transporting ATPase subunit b